MSEPKFTPGPWRHETIAVNGDHAYGYATVVVGAEPIGAPWEVCHVNGYCGGSAEDPEPAANAHLIAAAPDGYAAAVAFDRAMFDWYDGPEHPATPELLEAWDKACAFIRKAGGEPCK